MATKVDIANLAATHVGEPMIHGIEQDSKVADIVRENWHAVVDAVLRSYPWNCASRRAVLAPVTVGDPVLFRKNWEFMFLMPADSLRILHVGEDDNVKERFSLEDRYIYANINPLYIRYISRETPIESYDSMLQASLGLYFGHMLAMPIVQSSALKDSLYTLYERSIRMTRSVDAQENGIQQKVQDSSLMKARVGTGSSYWGRY